MKSEQYAKVISKLEKAVTGDDIFIVGLSGTILHKITEQTLVGNIKVPKGEYCAVDIKVLVAI